ncbi:OsmC family protein [Brevundimonas sp. SORGH_AS_0993]|uniref:OsmC family protein n=1 Tax=Brevundimonas sp. SORGH_AS_0993 TaxID=3041794 RepID=UPI0027870666|nr:OsmC family protein [Brevundimonas sp. SORGH_AS_0993]MDQ1154914.1 organic hydroperoxide reductase OsmC/OhrA [Brevundimonas sp. SORGH_AS_0993]
MSLYEAKIDWRRGDQPFTDKRYSRAHLWSFDGGAVVPASSAPSSVPLPMSDPAAVDPEEAMIASLSSCHMLWFLAFAANAGLVIDRYIDQADGQMGKDEAGRRYLAQVTLRPITIFAGRRPDQAELDALHHQAHDHCEMAHSVKATITVEAAVG